MRFTVAVFGLCLSVLPLAALSAAPLDLDTIAPDEPPEQLCDRLAADPFAGFGPDEWAHPFASVDFYRAAPACKEAMRLHPGEPRFALQAGIAEVAGDKKEDARALLAPLVAEGNVTAMLALAFITSDQEAAALMRNAADKGSAPAMLLFGMAELYGKGVAKDQIDGVRMIRRAADNGSTRAMLIMANFYNKGDYGVGFDPEQGSALIRQAAKLGDPAARNILASLEEGPASGEK
jgi:TPR repeat protein